MFRNLFDSVRDTIRGLFGSEKEPEPEPPVSAGGSGGAEPPHYEPPAYGGFDDSDDDEEPEDRGFFEPDNPPDGYYDALEDNLTPGEVIAEYGDSWGYDWLDQYRDELIDKLGLSIGVDDPNMTDRGIWGPDTDKDTSAWEEIQDYLASFHGGYPDDDLFELVLTDEGYELHVAIDSP